MAGQPKAPFYLVLSLVVIGLVGFAIYRSDLFAPEANKPNIGGPGGGPGAAAGGGAGEMEQAVEQPGPAGVTTVSEYKFKSSERLPAIRGASQYQALEDNTVRFALNVWAGWGPIILANDGFKAGHVWKTPDGEEFKVQLELIDNPFLMQDAFASGNVHIGWGTLDMLPLFLERQADSPDSRVMPRIYQQV
ncbi:MAG: hypothetical protein WD403_00105, partial [Pirellulales bacterium]